MAIFGDEEVLRPVLAEIYRHLDLPFDTTSVGSINAEAPRLTLSTLESEVIDHYRVAAGHERLVESDPDPDLHRAASLLVIDHAWPTGHPKELHSHQE